MRWEWGDQQMEARSINRNMSRFVLALSFIALATVSLGYTQRPLTDEGTLAHIFQLSILTLMPVGLLYLFTADWTSPQKSLRPLILPSVLVTLAFSALYYLEHVYYPAHYR